MRSIWTGAVSLGSVINLPVKVGSATKDNQLGLHMVRKTDGSPLKSKRVAEADGQEVEWHDIAKAYTAPDGSLVILGKDDFRRAYGEKNRVAGITAFTDASDIPPMAVKSAYWVEPGKGGEKLYALLASVLQQTGKVAVLTFAMRDREATAILRPHDGYLSLETLEWEADMLAPEFEAPVNTASAADHELALGLVETMTVKYDHSAHSDQSREAVQAIIQEKIEAGDVIAPPALPGTPVMGAPQDLTAMLEAAVAAQKGTAVPATAPKRASRKAAA